MLCEQNCKHQKAAPLQQPAVTSSAVAATAAASERRAWRAHLASGSAKSAGATRCLNAGLRGQGVKVRVKTINVELCHMRVRDWHKLLHIRQRRRAETTAAKSVVVSKQLNVSSRERGVRDPANRNKRNGPQRCRRLRPDASEAQHGEDHPGCFLMSLCEKLVCYSEILPVRRAWRT